MPYSDHYEQLEYYQLWYSDHRKQHLDKIIKNFKTEEIKI